MAAPSTDADPTQATEATTAAPAPADEVEMEIENEDPAEEDEDSEEEPEVKAEDSPAEEEEEEAAEVKKWPGWPGYNVFRMVVPVAKVGGIIGKKGDIIKKLCEETRAKVRILDGTIGTTDRIVLLSAKEEPEAEISPAMDAVLRVFKRINSISESGEDDTTQVSTTMCSVRLLVASSQAINLIGKQGSSIKLIQESSGATVRVLSGDDLPYYTTAEERIIDILGDSSKVLKALEAVVAHLRKFLVDHGVLHLFEKTLNKPAVQDRPVDSWADKAQSLMSTSQQSVTGNEYQPSFKRDSLYLNRESPLSQMQHSGFSSLYRQDSYLPVSRYSSSGLGRSAGALVTQVTQTMQIPIVHVEDIVGIRGGNIAYIRRASGASLTVEESGGLLPDEVTVEVKGTSTQVQTAQQLIQDFISGRKEPTSTGYEGLESGLRSSYSHLGSTTYPSASLTSSYGGYSSEYGGYDSRYRY